MHCDKTEKVSQLRDGRLYGDELLSVQLHLKVCDSCSQTTAEWENMSERFFRAQDMFKSPDFTDRVMAQLADDEIPAFRFITFPRLLWAGTLAAIIAILAIKPFIFPRKAANLEGTAFAVNLVSDDFSESDTYNAASQYLFGT